MLGPVGVPLAPATLGRLSYLVQHTCHKLGFLRREIPELLTIFLHEPPPAYIPDLWGHLLKDHFERLCRVSVMLLTVWPIEILIDCFLDLRGSLYLLPDHRA